MLSRLEKCKFTVKHGKIPLTAFQETAELVAQKEDWTQLYDCSALHAVKVPVASASYYDVSPGLQRVSISSNRFLLLLLLHLCCVQFFTSATQRIQKADVCSVLIIVMC